MHTPEVRSDPMPDPTDLDAVAGYVADSMDPKGNSPRLWIEIRRSLEIPPVVDSGTAHQAIAACIAIGRAINPRR